MRREIKDLLQVDNLSPSLYYWVSLLNYFEQHVHSLTLEETQALCDECERCRLYTNANMKVHPINQEDVRPNIYSQLEAKRNEDAKNSLPYYRHDVLYPVFVTKYS